MTSGVLEIYRVVWWSRAFGSPLVPGVPWGPFPVYQCPLIVIAVFILPYSALWGLSPFPCGLLSDSHHSTWWWWHDLTCVTARFLLITARALFCFCYFCSSMHQPHIGCNMGMGNSTVSQPWVLQVQVQFLNSGLKATPWPIPAVSQVFVVLQAHHQSHKIKVSFQFLCVHWSTFPEYILITTYAVMVWTWFIGISGEIGWF